MRNDQQPALVDDVACRRDGGVDPVLFLAFSTCVGSACDERDRLGVANGLLPRPTFFLGIPFVETAGNFDQFTDPDCGVVAEAIQALEHAGLLMRAVSGDTAEFDVGLTRLGRRALATDTVRQHLGLSDTPPAN
jgi:hypothetical protein